MQFITSHSGTLSANIITSSSEGKVQILQDAYSTIFTKWCGDARDTHLDRRTLSSMSYLSFYELIKGGGKRKKYGSVDVVEVGTHSFRKGVAEFLSGMVGGASPKSIYLRSGWSLGPVQSRYILEA